MHAHLVGTGSFTDPCSTILDDQMVGAAVCAVYDEISILI